MLLVSLVLSIGSIVFLNWYHQKSGKEYEMFFLADSQKPLALAVAFFSFLWFKNLKIKQSKIINTLSASTFGVLLIHTNKYVRPWLWDNMLKTSNAYTYKWGIPIAIVSVLGVYVVCVVIDQIQSRTVERLYLRCIKKIKWEPGLLNIKKHIT